jgi:hypothetical protein
MARQKESAKDDQTGLPDMTPTKQTFQVFNMNATIASLHAATHCRLKKSKQGREITRQRYDMNM